MSASSTKKTHFKAVLFDLGGVVFESPMPVIREFEEKNGLPRDFLNKHISLCSSRGEGAFVELEKGTLTLEQFYPLFEAECHPHKFSAKEMMQGIRDSFQIRQNFLKAIQILRASGYKTAAITNNWLEDDPVRIKNFERIKSLFDIFVESAREGLRKPNPKIYQIAVEKLKLQPTDCIFLDDIGYNLKAAKKLGIETIRVHFFEPDKALQQLSQLVGIELIANQSAL